MLHGLHSSFLTTGLLFFCLIATLDGSLKAQVVKLEDTQSFSEESTLLFLSELESGSVVNDAYSAFGLQLDGEASSLPTAEFLLVGIGFPGSFDFVINNQPTEGTSAGKALILRFDSPLVRFGVEISNGSETTIATLQAFTARGDLLGTVEQGNIDELEGRFVGLETSNPAGISTVVVDYGAEENPERIHLIRFELVDPKPFRTFLAQVAAGRVGNTTLQTIVQIQSLVRGTVEGQIRFFDTTGQPLLFSLNGEEISQFDFNFILPGSRRLTLEPSTTGEIRFGYAMIESNLPVAAEAIFQVLETGQPLPGGLRAEAGVTSQRSRVLHAVGVQRQRDQDLNTGLAVVNTSEVPTMIQFELLNENGEKPEEIHNQLRIELAAGGHLSFFLNEYCQLALDNTVCGIDFLADSDFRGSIAIRSVQPTVVTTLRTFSGLPRSSSPAGSIQQ